MVTNTRSMASDETVDVAAKGDDPIGRVACCILTAWLPQHVQEQVLLQCGKDMVPGEVVACAKQLVSAKLSTDRRFAAVAKVPKKPD